MPRVCAYKLIVAGVGLAACPPSSYTPPTVKYSEPYAALTKQATFFPDTGGAKTARLGDIEIRTNDGTALARLQRITVTLFAVNVDGVNRTRATLGATVASTGWKPTSVQGAIAGQELLFYVRTAATGTVYRLEVPLLTLDCSESPKPLAVPDPPQLLTPDLFNNADFVEFNLVGQQWTHC